MGQTRVEDEGERGRTSRVTKGEWVGGEGEGVDINATSLSPLSPYICDLLKRNTCTFLLSVGRDGQKDRSRTTW